MSFNLRLIILQLKHPNQIASPLVSQFQRIFAVQRRIQVNNNASRIFCRIRSLVHDTLSAGDSDGDVREAVRALDGLIGSIINFNLKHQ